MVNWWAYFSKFYSPKKKKKNLFKIYHNCNILLWLVKTSSSSSNIYSLVIRIKLLMILIREEVEHICNSNATLIIHRACCKKKFISCISLVLKSGSNHSFNNNQLANKLTIIVTDGWIKRLNCYWLPWGLRLDGQAKAGRRGLMTRSGQENIL